jgi:cellulose synthase/poly-beta-1,6-N-acetylglucosamine synthase-like glycosyltransferase
VWEEGIADVKGLFRQRMRWAEGSVRRFLDYLIPLSLSNKLTIRQRLDMTGFSIQFVWPFLTAFGIFNEMNHAVSGEQTYIKLLLAAFCSCGFNVFSYIFWSIRTHRSPVTFLAAFKGAFATSIYFFWLWCPCILVSLFKVLTQKKASSWALTQHGSPATSA